jgi:glucokinase
MMPETAARYVIGVDIGATNTRAAVIDSTDGRLVARQKMLTEAARGPDDGLRRIGELIHQVLSEAGIGHESLRGIGIGSTAPIDVARGRIQNPYTLPTWDDVPVVDFLTERFRLPAILLTDTHVAALGEYHAGAGQGSQHMLYVTISTGIGGGIVANGRLYRGVGQLSGEVGHQVLDLDGEPCYCGARGCWEMLASGPAMARFAAQRSEDGSLLMRLAGGDRQNITGKLVVEAARQGDSMAQAIVAQTGRYIGIGLANLMNILAPEVIVLGGGVMQSWEMLEKPILEGINERKGLVPFEQVKIVPAALGDDAGVVGAAYALLKHLQGDL